MEMSNARKQSRNCKKDHGKHATSTIRRCQLPDCTVEDIQSSLNRNPTTVATTNVSVSGQPPLQSSSTSAQSAAGQPLARPSPTNTGRTTPLPKSPEGPVLIAYVHNVSLLKRNKKNTIDYTTLTLQTDASTTQPAFCYSKAKRKLLDEHETKRAPIKITRRTRLK